MHELKGEKMLIRQRREAFREKENSRSKGLQVEKNSAHSKNRKDACVTTGVTTMRLGDKREGR